MADDHPDDLSEEELAAVTAFARQWWESINHLRARGIKPPRSIMGNVVLLESLSRKKGDADDEMA